MGKVSLKMAAMLMRRVQKKSPGYSLLIPESITAFPITSKP